MLAALRIIWSLAVKDLRLESRNRDVVLAVVMFAALVISIFVIAIDTGGDRSAEVASGVLWASVAFAGVVGLSRSMAYEMDGDGVGMLMLAPVSRDLLFLGKAVGNFVFLAVAEVVIFVLFSVLFNFQVFHLEVLLASLLATVGFSGVGTLFTGLTLKARAREILLPMLFLPVISPLLFATLQITSQALEGGSGGDSVEWLRLALIYDIVFVPVAAILFGQVLQE